MIAIAQFTNRRDAQIFADYCEAKGWQVKVEPIGDDKAVLYVSAPILHLVHEEVLHFQQHPTDPRYQAAAWQLAVPKDLKLPKSITPLFRRIWRGTGPLTVLVVAVCTLLFVLLQIFPQQLLNELMAPAEADNSWFSLRWLTPAFLHFSIEHLAFNLLAWMIYAGRMERQLGSQFLLGFLVVTAVTSNLLQWLATGPNFGGLSGVCFALFGFAWLYGTRYPKQILHAERTDLVVSLIFLALGFADMLWVNTANYAHLGGFVIGLVLALLPFPATKPR